MRIITAGRSDFRDFFRKSGHLEKYKLEHQPFLAFVKEGDYDLKVMIIDSVSKLLMLPDSTPVMAQWPGKMRSDFFKFTVEDVKEFLQNK